MFYLIFGRTNATGDGVSFAAFYMVGMASFGTLSGAFNNNTIRISQERKDGWIRQLRLTPLPANAYVVAKVLTSMVTTVPSILFVFVLGSFYGHVQMPIWKWVACAVAIWIGTLIFAALAVAVGYKLNPDSVQPVTIVVFFAFSIFGGLWFPLHGALEKFGEFTPTYQIVKLSTDVIAHRRVVGDLRCAGHLRRPLHRRDGLNARADRKMKASGPGKPNGGLAGRPGRTSTGTPRWRGQRNVAAWI
jgi:ABC-2 type transport system permease protein